MEEVCVICRHPELNDIDQAIREGTTRKVIAQRFNVSEGGLQRHKARHLTKSGAKRGPRDRTPREPNDLTDLVQLKAETQRIIDSTDDDKIRISSSSEPHAATTTSNTPMTIFIATPRKERGVGRATPDA